MLYGANKKRSGESIARGQRNKTKRTIGSNASKTGGYGGHFRAVQGFKYIGLKDA